MKKIHLILTLAAALLFSGCETLGGEKKDDNPSTQFQQKMPNGDVVTVVMTSEDFSDMQKTVTNEATRKECFKSGLAMPTDGTAQSLREMRLATGGNVDCGAGHSEALVAESDRKARQTESRTGLVKTVVETVVGGGLKAFGIDKAAEVAGVALNRSGNTTNVSGGSTYQGAQGENASYTEQISGIATQPAPVNPINFDGESDGEEIEVGVVDEFTCLQAGGTPLDSEDRVVGSEGAGLYFRCSDNSGGSL